MTVNIYREISFKKQTIHYIFAILYDMKEELLCIITPQARTYYKAQCVATEFLDKDNNVINTTGAIPDGEIKEVATTSLTTKHFENGKLHGSLEVINLTDNTITFSEEYDNGQLVCVTEHNAPLLTELDPEEDKKPIYEGTLLKTTKDVRAFYVDGKQVAEETTSANGATLELLGNIPDGEVKEFAENGKLKTEAIYQNNKLHGVLIRYNAEGKVLSRETYENGILKGPAQYYTYTQHDVLCTTCQYVNALLDGELTITQQDNTVRKHAHYANGRLHGPQHTYYATGTPESEENYAEGKLQGTRKLFFPTGQLWYEENYENGRLEGDRTEFFANGKPCLSEFYSDGMLNGQRNRYDQTGDLIASEEYHWGNIVHNTELRLQ